MKTLQELKAMQKDATQKLMMVDSHKTMRVVVGMATCGLTAGAKPIYEELKNQIANHGLDHVILTQVGCIGECALEPIVEVFDNSGKRTTYAKVTKEAAALIVEKHLKQNQIIEEQLIYNFK